MINPNYDYLFEDFLNAEEKSSSDISYVIRKMLNRGSREAELRYYLNEGDKAKEYKRLMYELELFSESLDDLPDDDGKIASGRRATVMEAIKLCQCLLAIDQAETNANYDNIVAYLTADLCETCRDEVLAA